MQLRLIIIGVNPILPVIKFSFYFIHEYTTCLLNQPYSAAKSAGLK